MENEIRIMPIVGFVTMIVACMVFDGFRSHYGTAAGLHRERQFNEDQEVFTFIRTWCDTKLVHLRESREKELAQLHAQFKADTMKNEELIKDCKNESEQ